MNNKLAGDAPESRRRFLGASARLAAGGAVALGASAQTAETPSDLAILNFALSLEQLQSAFYS